MRYNYNYEYIRDNENQIICFQVENNNFLAHFHSSLEIILVTAGELKVTLNGRVYTVIKDSILIIPSYYIHSYVTEEYSNSYILIIPLDAIPAYKAILSKKTFAKLFLPTPSDGEELVYCLNNLSKRCESSKNSSSGTIPKGYTYVFLGLLIPQAGLEDRKETKIISLAQEILIYLQESYLQPLALENISRHFGYSKSRFSHIFNEFFDCRLIEYINGLRCRHALEMLQEKKTTITDIAFASGFDSNRTFYRAFKKCFGCTPNEMI